MATREEKMLATIEKYKNVAKMYIEKDNAYDIVKFAKLKDASSLGSLQKWLAFAKDNLDEEDYEKFIKKSLPFEKTNGESNDELKQKVANVATRVFQKKANLVDVVNEVTTSMEQYIYMVKQLKFTYGLIPTHVFNKNLDFYERVARYNHPSTIRSVTIPSLSEKEAIAVEDIMTKNNFLDNDITYYEAYSYALRNGLVNLKTQEGRK
jgi:hypothetical protein